MFRLLTLGGLRLFDSSGASAVPQRLRLALLTALAAAGNRGVTRDKLLALFWPESPNERARASLDQLLYSIRHQLGDDVFEHGPDPVTLNSIRITSDLSDFLDEGIEESAALALYQGPFLDGFHLGGTTGFDAWADTEREQLGERYRTMLVHAAETAEGRGHLDEALGHYRSLAACDPLNTRAVLGLMRTMAVSGDSAGALRQAQVHEAQLREEFDAAPDPMVGVLVEQIRAGELQAELVPPARHALEYGTESDSARTPNERSGMGRRRHRLALGLGMSAILLVLLIGAVASRVSGHADSATGGTRVIVTPFSVMGQEVSSYRWLEESLVDLMSSTLDGVAGLKAVDPRFALSVWRRVQLEGSSTREPHSEAMELARATYAVSGRVLVLQDGGLEITATLLPSRAARGGSATVRGPVDSLGSLVTTLASQLALAIAGEVPDRVGAVGSASFPVVRAYLEGRAAGRHGEVDAAVSAFRNALSADSTFAPAALELAAVLGWLPTRAVLTTAWGRTTVGVPTGPGSAWPPEYVPTWHRAIRLATRYQGNLSGPDRQLLLALAGRHYPGPTTVGELLADWEKAATEFPDRPEVHFALGLLLLHRAPVLGVPETRERARAQFERALELDDDYVQPLFALMETAGQGNETDRVRAYAERFLKLVPEGELAEYVRWRDAVAGGDEGQLRAIRARFDSMSTNVLHAILRTSQMEGHLIQDADRVSRLLINYGGDREARRIAYFERALLKLNQGRPAEAAEILNVKRAFDPYDHVNLLQEIRFGLYGDGDTLRAANAAHAIGELLSSTSPEDTVTWSDRGAYLRAMWMTAQWDLWRGDATRFASTVVALRRAVADSVRGSEDLLAFLEALHDGLGGGPEALTAARRLDRLAREECCGPFVNIAAARLLERRGDLVGALDAARRARWSSPPDMLSTSLREEGRLAVAIGDLDSARAAWEHLIALSVDPETGRLAEITTLRQYLADQAPPK